MFIREDFYTITGLFSQRASGERTRGSRVNFPSSNYREGIRDREAQ